MTIFIKCSDLVELYVDTSAKQALEWQCLLSSSLTSFSRKIKCHLSQGTELKTQDRKVTLSRLYAHWTPFTISKEAGCIW